MGILSLEDAQPAFWWEFHSHMDILSQEDLQPSPLVVTLRPGDILSQEGLESCYSGNSTHLRR